MSVDAAMVLHVAPFVVSASYFFNLVMWQGMMLCFRRKKNIFVGPFRVASVGRSIITLVKQLWREEIRPCEVT